MKQEFWDACGRDGRPLGFDLVRGEEIPDGAYHGVVDVYTFTRQGEILLTQRHTAKPWPLQWEITGGSILKGETPEQGARRELLEETGIRAGEGALWPVYTMILPEYPVIFYGFAHVVDKEKTTVLLQEGETVAYRYMLYETFLDFVNTAPMCAPIARRFALNRTALETVLRAGAVTAP